MHLVLNFALNFFSSKHILIYILFSVPRLARYWRRREQALWEKGKRRLNLQRWVHLPFDIFAKIGSQFIMHFWMCVQLLRSEWFSETASISEFWRPATARHILDLLSELTFFWQHLSLDSAQVIYLTKQASQGLFSSRNHTWPTNGNGQNRQQRRTGTPVDCS